MTKPMQFVIDDERSAKLDRIAAAMAERYGTSVSRSSAVRHLIDLFSLPNWSFERPKVSQDLNQSAEEVAA